MNIFMLDSSMDKCVRYHCDKHIVKMPLETAQMVCTIAHKLGLNPPYLPVHAKHPCTLWGGLNKRNFMWLRMFGIALCVEYEYRYGRRHACLDVLTDIACQCWDYLPSGDYTDPPQAMPDEYKNTNVIEAYRRYYYFEKSRFAKWTKRPKPYFMEEGYYEALRA
jgi:hypothetical protein